MRKKFLGVVMVLVMVIVMLSAGFAVAAGGTMNGSGTEADPYQVTDAVDLAKIGEGAPGTHYKLMNNITLDRSFSTIDSFKGILNGNGKTISGLDVLLTVTYDDTITTGSKQVRTTEGALFNEIAQSGLVYNLTLSNPKYNNTFKDIPSSHNGTYTFKSGVFAVTNRGVIDSVTVTGLNFDGSPNKTSTCESYIIASDVGIFVFDNYGSIVNSTISGSVKFGDSDPSYSKYSGGLGGIAVVNCGQIANIHCSLNLTVDYWSGFTGATLTYFSPGVALNYGTMYNVWVDGSITNDSTLAISKNNMATRGFLCGQNTAGGYISNSYGNCTVSGRYIENTIGADQDLGSNYGITTSVAKMAFSQSEYNTNSSFDKAYNENVYNSKSSTASKSYLVTLKYGNEIMQNYINYGSNLQLPYQINDDYYTTSWTSDANAKYKPWTSVSLKKSTTFAASGVEGKYYPVMDGTQQILVGATEIPEYKCKWKQVGSDDYVAAPSDDDLARIGGMTSKIAQSNSRVYESDFKDTYTGEIKAGYKFGVRYTIPQNEYIFKEGTYNMYELDKWSYFQTPSFLVAKATIDKDNYATYLDVTLPNNTTYDGAAHAATVSGKTDTGVEVSVSAVKYKEQGSTADDSMSTEAPIAPGTYEVYVDLAATDTCNAATEVPVGSFTIGKATPTITYTLDRSDSTYTYGDDIVITGKVNGVANGEIPTGNVQITNVSGTMGNCALENGEFTVTVKADMPGGSNLMKVDYNSGDQYYGIKTESFYVTINKQDVHLTVSGTEQKYEAGVAKQISFTNDSTALSDGDFVVKYYKVDENENKLVSTTPVSKAIATGRYFYVISLSSDADTDHYQIANEYIVTGTTIPADLTAYGNIGFMDIKIGSDQQQKPIYFKNGVVNKKTTDAAFTNDLVNPNSSTVTYTSSDSDIASVDNNGLVTIKGAGSVTITATSEKEETTPVYAGYTLNITKETVIVKANDAEVSYGDEWISGTVTYPGGFTADSFEGSLVLKTNYTAGKNVGMYTITPSGFYSDIYDIQYESATLTVVPKALTADDFTVTAENKTYDGTKDAKLTVTTQYAGIKGLVEGSFADADAGADKTVNYTITDLTGSAAANYELQGGKITGTTTAEIYKATVSVICAESTTRTYDGSKQKVEVTAMANGAVFKDYTVKYLQNGIEVDPVNVGTYEVSVVLNDETNYTVAPFNAELVITNDSQDNFTIDDVPQVVYYGDTFKVSADGASGDVTYTVSGNAAIDQNGNVAVTGTGKVTITATSKKTGFKDKTATTTFTANKRILTATAAAADRVYNGSRDVDVTIDLANIANNDNVTATAKGAMTDANVGKNKVVYVSDITLAGDKANLYTVSSVPVQTEVTISAKELTADDFAVTALPKYYDGTDNADVTVTTSVAGVQAVVEGSFADADAGADKTVNYTIADLSGSAAANYKLAGGKIKGTATAEIYKAKISVICAESTTRTYDGSKQKVDLTAMVNGGLFKDYTIKYLQDGNEADPVNVGTYQISVVPDDTANYEVVPFNAELVIKNATQDVFAIEGVPEAVYYGDNFTVTADNAGGDVTYTVSGNATVDQDGNVVVTGTGKVTITATSQKTGYTDKTAAKTFTANKRVLTTEVTAVNKVYDGSKDVEVTVALDNFVNQDDVKATAKGAMADANAGTDKLVYVTEIALTGDKADLYTVQSANAQTSVDIAQRTITAFTVSALDKKYDGSDHADVNITNIEGLLAGDEGQVTIIGDAVFDDENSGENKVVTFTANAIGGSKGGNYKFADDDVKTQTTSGNIEKVKITFTLGNVSFIYDGQEKSVAVSAADENGGVFRGYTVKYLDANGGDMDSLPVDAGSYMVAVELNDTVNYETDYQTTDMVIASADQDQISAIGLPGTVCYDDEFELEALGGNGTGEFIWTCGDDNIDITVDAENSALATVKVNGSVGQKVTINVTKAADGNYGEKSTKVVFVPAKKNVSFVIGNLEQAYDGEAKEVTVTPDDTNAQYTVKYNGSTEKPIACGTYNVKVEAEGNYYGSANATLVIAKSALSGLTIRQQGTVYGSELPDAQYDQAPDGVDVTVKYSTADGQKPVNAGKYVVTATYTGDNYETYETSAEFEISKKELTVKAKDAERAFGEANPVFELIYDGFVEGENANNLFVEPVASVEANASSPVGEYPITVSGGRADNYTFKYDNTGVMTVTGAIGGKFYITGSGQNVTVGDIFNLYAYYGSTMPDVKWSSDNQSVATVDENGLVTVLASGTVTIEAEITDNNYQSGITAEITLNADKKAIALTAVDNVKVYNSEIQTISLISDDSRFVPVLDGADKNVEVSYTLTTDPTVTEPVTAGVYTVHYTIPESNPAYKGSGTATLYINKANAVIKAKDVAKIYGEANPQFEIIGLLDKDMQNADYVAKVTAMFNLTSDADELNQKAGVGEYPITVALKDGRTLSDDQNYNFTISEEKGVLTINPASLIIKVADVTREYGQENAAPEFTYVGFVNGENEDVLTAKPTYEYKNGITKDSDAGLYVDAVTMSGVEAANYAVTYEYADGSGADLTITPMVVNVVSGSGNKTALTVKFDREISGLTADNFNVTLDGAQVALTRITERAYDGKSSYTLYGEFTINKEYSVAIDAGGNYQLIGNPVIVKAVGGGGGGGGSNVDPVVKPADEVIKLIDAIDDPVTKDSGDQIEKARDAYDKLSDKDKAAVTNYPKLVEAEKAYADLMKPDQPGGSKFTDTEDHWAEDAIDYVVKKGLMNGVTDTTFEPETNMSRAMMVTVLWRLENEPKVETKANFADVAAGSYYEDAVAWANANGIVKGYDAKTFGPNDNITREQMAAIFYRYASFKGYDVSKTADLSGYSDADQISAYAVDNVKWANAVGLINGRTATTLVPQGNSTRAEVATMLQRFIENIMPN